MIVSILGLSLTTERKMIIQLVALALSFLFPWVIENPSDHIEIPAN